MTIRIIIVNDDTRDNAIVSVAHLNPDGTPVEGVFDRVLHGGQSTGTLVHSGQKLLVEEVRHG